MWRKSYEYRAGTERDRRITLQVHYQSLYSAGPLLASPDSVFHGTFWWQFGLWSWYKMWPLLKRGSHRQQFVQTLLTKERTSQISFCFCWSLKDMDGWFYKSLKHRSFLTSAQYVSFWAAVLYMCCIEIYEEGSLCRNMVLEKEWWWWWLSPRLQGHWGKVQGNELLHTNSTFRPGSVQSGPVSWDDFGRVFSVKLRAVSFPW